MDVKHKLDVPFDMNTRYLHGINVRLEVLIEQLSSLVEHIAKQDKVATTEQAVDIPVVTQVRRKK